MSEKPSLQATLRDRRDKWHSTTTIGRWWHSIYEWSVTAYISSWFSQYHHHYIPHSSTLLCLLLCLSTFRATNCVAADYLIVFFCVIPRGSLLILGSCHSLAIVWVYICVDNKLCDPVRLSPIKTLQSRTVKVQDTALGLQVVYWYKVFTADG